MAKQHPVLILCPTKSDTIYAQPIKPSFYNTKFKFIPITWTFEEPFDLMKYITTCEELVRNKDILHVVSLTDVGALVHTVLCQRFPHLKGPSVESNFLATHKYYSRQYLETPETQLKHAILNIDEANDQKAIENVLNITGIPGFLKPCTGTRSYGVSRIFSKFDLEKQIIRHKQLSGLVDLKPYFLEYVDQKQYPYSAMNCVIVEELVTGARILTLDGCVIKGEVFHWVISESLYWKTHPKSFKAVVLPASIEDVLEAKLWKVYNTIVAMMIAKGFDNQFVNIEVFVKPNSEIKLMEINPRMFPQALTLYRLCIAHGDPVSTLLDGNLGMRPQAPHLTGKYGVNGYVNTFGNGKAEDLFDFEAASGYKEIQCLFSPGEVVPLSGEEGSNLAFINVCSETEEGAMKKYFTLCRKVVKKPDLSPWDE